MTEHEKKIGTVLKCKTEGDLETLECSCGNNTSEYDKGGSFVPVDKELGRWDEGCDFNEFDFILCKKCGAIIDVKTLVVIDYITIK